MSPAARSETVTAPAPAVRDGIVLRRRLFEQLGEAGRVTVISAPAGSGKTVLVQSWAADAGLAEQVAWVPVHEGERDPQRFWISVADALRATAAGAALVQGLTAAPDLDGRAIVERLLADLGSLADRVWLVLDDLHELGSAEALAQLELLVSRAPATLRFVLAARRDLRLGLHRLRLAGEVTELRAADLRFSLAESRALLAAAGVTLPEAALGSLQARTEGWVAGLRLAALSLAGHPDPERFAAEFCGSERTVAEYLLTEVLERQPPEVIRLLLRTSVLERVSGPLADVLTGESGGERILQDLEAAGAFVVALDTRRSWFRYHSLFTDLLQLQLRCSEPAALPALHTAAARWFAGHGHPAEAVRHAQAAADWDLAARLLCDQWLSLMLNGQGATAHELLTGFPCCAIRDDVELIALVASDELNRGSPEEAARYLAQATEGLVSVPEERREQLQILLVVLRLFLARRRGDLPVLVEETRRLLALTQARDTTQPGLGDDLRTLALLNLGIAELWSLRLDEAERHLDQGLALARRIGRPYLEVSCLAYGAMAARLQSLAVGEQRAKQAIELARRHGWGEEPIAAVAYAALAGILVWQGRLAEAGPWLAHAERRLRADVEPATEMLLYFPRGLAGLARGRYRDALAAFEAADQLADRLAAPHPLVTRTRAFLLGTLLRLGETGQVEAALAALPEQDRDTAEMRTVAAALCLARRDPQRATAALGSALDDPAPVSGVRLWVTQAFLLEGIARDALGDPAAAARAVERALDLAEPEGMLLPFLLQPAPGLLERQASRRTAHAALLSEIQTLLAEGTRPPAPAGPLSEPLSDSETRILRYLPTNLSAPQIAGQLYLSVHTVRTHMRHVYAKLGAHHRHEAVQRARALGLLAPSGTSPGLASRPAPRTRRMALADG